jgi:hypothetical protein
MTGSTSDSPPAPRIDSAAKAALLAGLREGLAREDAAAAAGFSLTGFYGARRRDPAFAADWAAALALQPAAERRTRAYAERGEDRIAPANRRLLQRRRRRHVRFTAERRELYVARLAQTCDSTAAAEAAGVHPSTARRHRTMDPVFDSACREALDSAIDSWRWRRSASASPSRSVFEPRSSAPARSLRRRSSPSRAPSSTGS